MKISYPKWALAQLVLSPSIIMAWRVKSWVGDPMVACVTYQYKTNKKKKINKKVCKQQNE